MIKKRILLFATTNNNENDIIIKFSQKIFNILPSCDILVVNDHSDHKVELVDLQKEMNNQLSIIQRPKGLGVGSAYKLAIIHSIQQKYETLVTLNADFSNSINDIPRLLEKLEQADFVIASKYMNESGTNHSNYINTFTNWLTRKLLTIPQHDVFTSLRAFRVSALEKLDLSKIGLDNHSFFLESLFWMIRQGLKGQEIPIDIKNDTGKMSHSNYGKYTLLRLFIARFSNKNLEPSSQNSNLSCYFCKSPYLTEKYPQRGKKESFEPKIFKCTSTKHLSKPQIVQCLVCGLTFVPQTIEINALEKLYSEVTDNEYLSYKNARYKTFEETFKKIFPYLPNPGKLLEIGAYCGIFLSIAKSYGWQVSGIEPSKWAARYSRDQLKLDVKEGSINENFSQLERDYDVIVLWDVLEHLSDPFFSLQQINTLLRKDGILCFSTLTIDNWFPKLMGNHWPWFMEMHLFYFTEQVLEQVLKKAGFKIVHFQNYCHYVSIKYFIDKVVSYIPYKIIAKMITFLKYILPKNLFIPFRFGDIKIFICKKIT